MKYAFIIIFIGITGLVQYINCITSKKQHGDKAVIKNIISTLDAPKPIGPYHQAIQIDHILYLSGQIGIDPKINQLVSDDIKNQTQQIFRNIKAILKVVGSNLSDLIRCLVLVIDMNDYQSVNEIYASVFSSNKDYPVRSMFSVKKLPANAKIEIECTAYSRRKSSKLSTM